MNADVKSMLGDACKLLVITVISGLLLGGVYQLTKDPIAAQELKAKQEACKAVFAEAASFNEITDFDSEAESAKIHDNYPKQDIDGMYEALDASGNVIGYVINVTTHEGYGGDIQFSLGISDDSVLNGMSLLSISETAGLGMRAGEVLVPQFKDKPITVFTYTKTGSTSDSEIDAISGATITTNAVTNGVNAGIYYYATVLKGGASE